LPCRAGDRCNIAVEGLLAGHVVPLLSHWYFHLPNFVLAALMYTLLGRALLGLMVAPDSSNYIWRFFCRITDPFVALIAVVTPKAAAPVVIWLFGVVWLFWLRVGLLYLFALSGATHLLVEEAMDRNYYIALLLRHGQWAFNQTWLPFAYLFARCWRRHRCSAVNR
jgi:YggT family protein